ncbi:alkaline phosphatase PhoX, partial [Streptomyces scabiei]|uniref:alkaline phosphatase PhoX n=1 Tax=Streptomyces scabiei TaxID=1930 RepID=UPI0038F611F9
LSRSAFGKVPVTDLGSNLPAYGPLIADSNKLLDLPAGFSYKVISELGEKMDDGQFVPNNADGMGCFTLDDDRVALVRNHELKPTDLAKADAAAQTHK